MYIMVIIIVTPKIWITNNMCHNPVIVIAGLHYVHTLSTASESLMQTTFVCQFVWVRLFQHADVFFFSPLYS